MSWARSLASTWNRYWFRPAPVLDLAVCRVLVVGFQLFVMAFPYVLLTFPVFGMLDLYVSLPAERYDPEPLLMRALLLPFSGVRPSLEATQWVLRLSMVAGVFALIGWRTRWFCALFALGNLFLAGYGYCFGEHHHVEALTVVMLSSFAFAPSGMALSVDAWWSRRRGTAATVSGLDVGARWPLLLMRWMFSLCYLSAALCKLGGGGLKWLNGSTIQYYVLQDATRWGARAGLWVASHFEVCLALGWFTIVVEGLFFLVLLWPRLALFFVPAAVAMHLGIYLTMRAPFFLYTPLYAVFVPWSALWRRLRPKDRVEER